MTLTKLASRDLSIFLVEIFPVMFGKIEIRKILEQNRFEKVFNKEP